MPVSWNLKVKERHNTGILVGVVLSVIATVAVIAYFLTGKTSTNVQEIRSADEIIFISCNSSVFSYPFFRYDYSEQKLIVIDGQFINGKIKSIAIKFRYGYTDEQQAMNSRLQNQAALGISLGADGLSADDLAMGYTVQDKDMIISLYADENTYNNVTKKYFSADDIDANVDADGYIKNYQEKGFICEKRRNTENLQ